MKATAIAPANIAFIKYWGKRDEILRTPLNDSLSMNLSAATTTTTVEFDTKLKRDEVVDVKNIFSDKEKLRICNLLIRIRALTNIKEFARVATRNSFPKGIGSAASASGFAALAVAACAAKDIKMSEKELTVFARLGSGSACRSIPDGFVHWIAADSSQDSYAYSLYPSSYWDIRDILVIVNTDMKKVSTTDGMEYAHTSEFIQARVAGIPDKVKHIKTALLKQDFTLFGEIIEQECHSMHAVMMTQKPMLLYWLPETLSVMQKVFDLRQQGIECYYTIDAGPSVHVICEGKDAMKITDLLSAISGVYQVVMNKPAQGAKITTSHLF